MATITATRADWIESAHAFATLAERGGAESDRDAARSGFILGALDRAFAATASIDPAALITVDVPFAVSGKRLAQWPADIAPEPGIDHSYANTPNPDDLVI